MLAGIGLATSSSASAQPLSDPRVVGVIAALVGSLLLANGCWTMPFRNGWRVVAVSAALAGAVAIVIGVIGFTMNRWTELSAAAAICAVAGLFGVLPLMTAGIRAQPAGWGYGSTLGSMAAPFALAAVVVATAPGPSTRGFEGAIIEGVVIYAFGWSILKTLLAAFSDGTNPPAAGPAAAMSATLRGNAMIAGVVAVVLGSALLLIRVTRASVDTRTIVVLLLLFGLPVVALVIALVWSDLFDPLVILLVFKANVLFVFPAIIAPGAVLAAGGVCVAAGLIARIIPTPASLPQDLPPASGVSATLDERDGALTEGYRAEAGDVGEVDRRTTNKGDPVDLPEHQVPARIPLSGRPPEDDRPPSPSRPPDDESAESSPRQRDLGRRNMETAPRQVTLTQP